MTPGARVAAAIAVLDRINAGQPAEAALTGWARASRFAGAGDRAAVRDHVFAALRRKRSLGAGDGRALMLRLLAQDGGDIASLFNGVGHAPAACDAAELAALAQPMLLDDAARCDLPDWLWPVWRDSLGAVAVTAAQAQQQRADVFLRVNRRRGDPDDALAALAQDGIGAVAHPVLPDCLRVCENARRIKTSAAYLTGRVELQDAASQRAVAMVPVAAGARVLDFCAGGGGKALAFADRHNADVFAHDAALSRMKDIAPRAARAGVRITPLAPDALAGQPPFDVVFTDAPCSGSGTWRRTPDAKWRLTPARLAELCALQGVLIAQAARLVAPGGLLAYATCSVLACENDAVIAGFVAAHPGWRVRLRDQAVPGPDGDGFFLCLLDQKNNQ